MKLYVSADIEGVAGLVHWDQVMPGSAGYSVGQRLLMRELDSLCRGATIAGAESITVNDAHSSMRNVVPDELPSNVRLITGHFKPMYMMQGLDETFDAAVFLAYHGAAGSSSVLSHTYSPKVIWEARIDGAVTGETGINALVAHHFRVPVVMITGDEATVEDAKRWIPEAAGLALKTSVGRFAADSLSPEAADTLIFDTIQAAVKAPVRPPEPAGPITLQLTLQSAEMATLCEWAGVYRSGDRVVELEAENGLELYRKFHIALLLARTVADG